MAITAKHVIADLLSRDPGVVKGKPPSYEYRIIQVMWKNGDHNYVVWTIDSIGTSPHADIGIIWLKPYDQNAVAYKLWKTVQVTLEPPAIGSKIRAFGLDSVCFDGSRWGADGKLEHLEVKCGRSTSTGIVRQHYWQYRDRGFYKFPCFEVDARFDHGMSGGLVITEDSVVCGIVCGSLPTASVSEAHVSYASMLWPMMAIPVSSYLVPNAVPGARYRLHDLSAKGIFTPIGWDRVSIKDEIDSGGTLSVRYER